MYDAEDRSGPLLTISSLPSRSPTAGTSHTDLVEASRYAFWLDTDASVDWSPHNHVEALDGSGRSGTIQTREAVGTLILQARARDRPTTWMVELEVRPTKLSQASYDELWRAVTERAVEATVHGFAPSYARLRGGDTPASLRYVRVAQIAAAVDHLEARAAFDHVVGHPHRGWHSHPQSLPPGRAVPATGALGRLLSRPGRRVAHAGIAIPVRLTHDVPESSYDTEPNRFCRWVLENWLADVDALADCKGADSRVGRLTLEALRDEITDLLSSEPFCSAARRSACPSLGDSVLQRRDGYREILAAFFRVELAPVMDPELGDPPVLASRRNVATLYELWCCLEVIRIIDAIVGGPTTSSYLVPNEQGTGLRLQAGSTAAATWTTTRWIRPLAIDLYYNRTFSPDADPLKPDTSWTQRMRPDISLNVRPYGEMSATWLHLDAKYRLGDLLKDRMNPLFDEMDTDDDDPTSARSVVRSDLLKMHAYRDAIRGSSGAYVLFPSIGEPETRRAFTEVLPGLGAFAFRPGTTAGQAALRGHLEAMFEHVADPSTREARARSWVRAAQHLDATFPPLAVLLVPADSIVDNRWSDLPPTTEIGTEWLSCHVLVEIRSDGAPKPDCVHRMGPWEVGTDRRITAWLSSLDPETAAAVQLWANDLPRVGALPAVLKVGISR